MTRTAFQSRPSTEAESHENERHQEAARWAAEQLKGRKFSSSAQLCRARNELTNRRLAETV